MARPKGYYTGDGKRVPGVTTILARLKDSGGLIHWAWKLGMEGIDYRDVRDDAATIGHVAHAMAEAHIRGVEPDLSAYPTELIEGAKKAYDGFLQWAEDSKLEAGETETPMVSETYKYGGTPDVFFVRGERTIGDWKSSGAVYPEYLCQLAAYRQLWIENHPGESIAEGGHIIRFDKEHGDFHHHYYSDLNDAWEAFKHMRALYDLMAGLKKRVG